MSDPIDPEPVAKTRGTPDRPTRRRDRIDAGLTVAAGIAIGITIGVAIGVAISTTRALAAPVAEVVPTAANAGLAASSALPAWAAAAFESLRGVPPLLFFGAFVVATFVPFPVGLFYLAAGAIHGVGPALAWIAASLTVSNLILHTAAHAYLRPRLEPLVVRRGYRIPRFESGLDEILFITLIRLTPGIPYFLQNLILAAARLDLVRFLVLSVAIQMLYVTGFVVLGRSALDGQLGWALAGLAALVALSAVARIVVRRRKPGEPPL